MQINVKNRSIFCQDNLDVLQGINSECVDLIYLDPPFNKKKTFTAPIGSSAEGASFRDIFKREHVKNEWLEAIEQDNDKIHTFLGSVKTIEGRTSYNFCYLSYMAIRLTEMHRILKDTGSLYLHCDATMSHYLKILMDIIFGEKNFRNEIIWCYSGGGTPEKDYPRKHDTLLRYVKTDDYVFNVSYKAYKENTQMVGKHSTLSGGKEIDLHRGTPITDWWIDIRTATGWAKERVGYPTQKPLALLERIIKASSHEGDMVLDPFCGCATTCVASEKLGRHWVGIDVAFKAFELVKKRLQKEVADPENLLQYENKVHCCTSPPKRTDRDEDYREKKYVYVISNPVYKEGLFKVGVSSHMQSRLGSYNTGDPDRGFKVEDEFLTPDFDAIEKHIHEEFKYDNEWVQGHLQEIIEEIKHYSVEKSI